MRRLFLGLIYCKKILLDTETLMGIGLDGIPEDSTAQAERAEDIPDILECVTAMVERSQIFLSAQEFSPE